MFARKLPHHPAGHLILLRTQPLPPILRFSAWGRRFSVPTGLLQDLLVTSP